MEFGLTPPLLLAGYAQGIFPMSEGRGDTEVFWVDPQRRGVFPLEGFHISRSLSRRIRGGGFRVTFNRAFADVVSACADRPETWINGPIQAVYGDLHDMGHGHSIEVWHDDRLIGGVYGVAIGGAFFGESMFSRATDASKLALAYLVDRLRQCGFVLFDTQFLTAHLASLGAIEISRAEYRHQLAEAIELQVIFDGSLPTPDGDQVLQRNTQTS